MSLLLPVLVSATWSGGSSTCLAVHGHVGEHGILLDFQQSHGHLYLQLAKEVTIAGFPWWPLVPMETGHSVISCQTKGRRGFNRHWLPLQEEWEWLVWGHSVTGLYLSSRSWTPGRPGCDFALSLGAEVSWNVESVLHGSCVYQRAVNPCPAMLRLSKEHQLCGREHLVGPAGKTGLSLAPQQATSWPRAGRQCL
jgi:hypothetical protein